ncbi:plectin isoform X26 [Esox lucius]|uniref:plectin isoform X26 n=1 Tax=Esox lucius TaxID=8010 RepID=UPI001476B3FD|nr:plectin isoform X26 [Esox lucius]
MVAGMVIPLADLRTIYELLFRDGVMVAKKDKRPQTKHPEIPSVGNLQVMRAMVSLKSRGYVKETFAWRHFYWYLTNEGIVYLRDYLRLPAEIVPSSLQRVRRSAATLPVVQRATRGVQSVEGPTSYVPKPGKEESREAMAERQGYRHKRMVTAEEEGSDWTPRFRGRPVSAESVRPRASWESEAQPPLGKGRGFRAETSVIKESQVKRVSTVTFTQTAEDRSRKPAVTSQEEITTKVHTERSKVQKIFTTTHDSQGSNWSVSSKTAVAAAAVAGATVAGAVKVSAESSSTKVGKEKPKKAEMVTNSEGTLKVSVEPVTSKPVIPATLPTTKEKKEEKLKGLPEPKKATEVTILQETPKFTAEPPVSFKPESTSSLLLFNGDDSVVTEKIIEKIINTETMVIEDASKLKKEKYAGEIEKALIANKPPVKVPPAKDQNTLMEEALECPKTLSAITSSRKPKGPESTKETKASVQIEPKSEVKIETKSKVNQKIKPEISKGTKPEVQNETKPEVKKETKPEINTETKPEVKKETKPDVKKETKPEVNKETKAEINEDTKPEFYKEDEAEVKKETKAAVKKETKAEVKKETKAEIKKETKAEIKMETKAEINKDTKSGVIKETKPEVKKETKAEVKMETQAEVKTETKLEVKKGRKPEFLGNTKAEVQKEIGEHRSDGVNETLELSITKAVVCQTAPQPIAAPPVIVKEKEVAEKTSVSEEKRGPAGSSEETIRMTSVTHSSEVSFSVETVTMQKSIKTEMSQEAHKRVQTQHAPVPEAKAPVETVISPKAKKAKKKKQPSATTPETSTTKLFAPSVAETFPQEVSMNKPFFKVNPLNTSGETVIDGSLKMPSERMWSEETSTLAAGAPALDKGEAEPAQRSPEKIKREDPKSKTSSSARESPAAVREAETASVGAEARDSLHIEQGRELPRVIAQHSGTLEVQSTEQQKEKRVSVPPKASDKKKGKKPPQTVAATAPLPEQPHLETDTQEQFVDEANMRKKIVVVEEVIEVQQITSPESVAAGEVPPPVVPDTTGDDLDYDVLQALAIERALLTGGAVVKATPECEWDHSLDEPEGKTFPNFVEDERDRVQKKTFTKWVNKHLIKHCKAEAQRHVSDLYEDLRDGHNLISLLEVLSGDTLVRDAVRNMRLPREKGRMRFHKLQNVQIALDFLRHRQVKLVNIRNDDIADGNPKLTLGLIWTIILHFQISDIQINGQSEDMTAKEKLLLWSQRMTEGYQGIRCDNFTTSWRDGKLFNAVIHKHHPRLIDMSKVYRQNNIQNLEQAFNVAERDLGVTRLLDPEDVDVPHPDEKSIITYVSSLYDAMPRMADGMQANELELRWTEYYELITIILQWIRHHVIIFEERRFPGSYEEIEILWRQFLKFKETELPPKEADKNRSKLIYQSFESAVHAGQVKVPPGYHPIDVEKEWGRLTVAILERERLLRIEFERLERLQRVVGKVQMESGVCEEQLNQLETLLKTDIRLLSAGKPAQHTAEVERDLDKADGMIRLLFNDVQLLKDGRHIQAEQMYRRVYRLHERLVNLRTDYNLRLKSSMVTSQVIQSPTLSQQQQSTRMRPELDEVTLRYAQDLLTWVEENQRRIDEAVWGLDLSTVESQLGSHRGLHQTVEDFRAKIERAKADEVLDVKRAKSQLSPVSKGTYSQYLAKLDLQYAKLLNSSKSRLRNLDSLHAFVSAATKELMWLNDKEEEEVSYDWSDRNTNMTAKKDNYSGLMRELEMREKKVNNIQATGDKLLKEGHPGRNTVEAFTAGLQTQWSWILQLCCCIETHLKENTAYYQFFADVKEADERMKKMQEAMKKKYSCDRSTTATRLEDLLQDAMDEKEQLNEFKTHVAGLNKRAKTIIQLKPRNPTTPIKGKLPIQAVCDFKQMEITVHKGEECALLDNSPQPNKWKVLNRSGYEAVVPSVCFLVPPVNKDAMESVSSLDSGHQSMLLMWQTLHMNMKSLLSWQYLMRDITQIRSWNITMFRTMKVEEYRLVMRNLELHYQDFMRDSQDSQLFGPGDRMQIEGDYTKTTQYYDNLQRSVEKGHMVKTRGEQDESTCVTYITQIKDLRLRIEDCEARTLARIRKPVDKDALKDCAQKTSEQKKVQVELEGIKKNVDQVAVKTEEVLSTASQQSSTAPVLRSELDFTLKKMDNVYILSSVYLEKLKTVELVIRNTQGVEDVLKKYEDRLREVQTVPNDVKEVETYRTQLKKMRGEAESEKPSFDALDDELRKAAIVSEKMSRVHNERDAELDHYRHLLSSLQDRWLAVFSQMELRLRELEQLGRQLGYYRESYDWLIQWISDAKQRQEKIQAVPISDSKTLKEQLAQEKKLLEEIEQNKEKVDECHKYAKAYIDTIKDYELQLVAYKAQVEPLSPLKKTKMDSASDNIIQEYVTLRTRYSELMTLTSQYIKFITDTQRRLEDEEMANAQQKQIQLEKTVLQQTFITEKEELLKKEKQIEEEKKKLENQFEEEVKKARALKEEQERQRKQMEEEKNKLQATMDAALNKQKEAEKEMLNKQKEMQELERKRIEQEKLLAEENKKLREKLQQLEVAHKEPVFHTREIDIQTDHVPEDELIHKTEVGTTKQVINGQSVLDEVDSKKDKLSFDGIREKVPASRLYDVGLLSKKEFDKLKKGKTTVEELSQTDKLRTILKGTNCIAGVLTQSNQKMPIYQAMKEKKITPSWAYILLEAQAATGYVVDPIKNKKLTVSEAVKDGLIGPELHNKMLSAERAVTGYKDPYTGNKISLFEAMKKDLIDRDHALRQLEAQMATGGIIDPINSHRVPIETAYKQGLFDTEMNKILEEVSEDTKGFFDPNTQEDVTYNELMQRCSTDPETGLLLLPITDKAALSSATYTEEETKDVFNKTTVSVPFGKFQGKTVTIWEIINSEYFTEDQRKNLIRQYKTGKITVEKIIRIVITMVEEKEKKNEIAFDGLRAPVPATELLESKIIDKDLYNKLHKGNTTIKEVSEMEPVRKALKGTNCIAGVVIDSTKETMSFYEAMKKDMMRAGPALNLLEAQAGTGFVVDPVNNQKFTVDEAVKAAVIGPELHEKLLSAERGVTGYKDPYTGKTVSLFQAMKKELIPKDQGIRLLDAQLTTGGIIDPVKSHHIPHDVACKRGYFDDEMNQILSNPTDDVKGFFDPNTNENVTYSQLYKRCVTDKKTGLQLLPLSEQAINAKNENTYTDIQTKEAMTQATVELQSGPLKGKKLTIWEIINSEYFTEEQRFDLMRQYRSGKITIEKIIKIVITIVEEKEQKKQEKDNFKGLRAPVPAKSLLDSKIIDNATFDMLLKGKKSPKQVSENENINKYLQGSDSIAGVYLEPTKEKISIYQAMKKNLLRHNTGLSLLEAQAATGFIVDPVRNQYFSVDDAVKAGIVGPELHEKLLSAEKAVTGYKDPFTGQTISLFQAMEKGLIIKEHAMPLLEAQLSSGGIIDPVNSHRVPIEIAYQKSFFSKEMAHAFSEPSEDNKAYSDPNSDEKVTYKQLKDKCTRDPDSGMNLLPISKPQAPTVVEKTYLYTEEQTQIDLASTNIDLPSSIEALAGGSKTLWDIMNSNLLPDQERKKLMDEYRSGSITKERMIIIIIEIMEQREIITGETVKSCNTFRRRVTIEELYNARIIDLETFNLLKQDKRNIRDIMEMQSVKQYLFGTGSIAGVMSDSTSRMSIYSAMKRGLLKPEIAFSLLEAQAATGFIIDPVKKQTLTVDEAVRKGVVGPEIHDKLLSAERAVTGYKDPYTGKIISLFQAMKKDLVPEEYALKMLEAQTATGGIMDPEFYFHLPADIATQRGFINKETYEMLTDEVKGFVDPVTEEKLSYAQLLKRCKIDPSSGMRLLSLGDKRIMFKGLRKEITIEEMLRSEIIDQNTVNELNEGLISLEEVSNRLRKYLEGTSCIAGVYVERTNDRLSIYQAMKKNMIRPGTAFELLEAQAATGYVIDPIKNLKLTVSEAVKLGIVGPEFKDKLLSAERAVTGYRDPYSGKTISLFQAMKKGLILKDHGIRLLEAQIATGGIIDPQESHRLPVEVAYNRGLFDEEMNEILTDPSDDTKGFFDPNTEENLTYLGLMERCITDPQTGLVLLLLKEKKRETKASSTSSVRKRRVVIVDPESGKEMSVYEAYRKKLIDHQTYLELAEQECEWEEITKTSSDGVVKSIIIDRRSGRQYDIDDALARGLIDQTSLDTYRSGNLAITEFADMLSGNMSGFRSRSSSISSTSSSYNPMSPIPSIRPPATIWNDPTDESGPVAGILDTDTLEKVSITEAMHRNLVDNITGQRLLEAQACTGGIIDPTTGERFAVAEATDKGLVDKVMVDRINLAHKAFIGFDDPRTKVRMSASQALKKGWLYYEAGQRFLEVQYLTGGLIEPNVEGRVSLDESIKKGTIDARTAQKLRDVSAYSKYLTCPKTKLKISYKDAMDRSMVEEGSGLRLLEASSQSTKGLYSPYNASNSGSAAGSRSGSRTGSRTGSRRGSFDATGSGFSMNFSSSSYTSSSSYGGRRYNAGPHTGLNIDELAQALTALAVIRPCSSEQGAFAMMIPIHTTVA